MTTPTGSHPSVHLDEAGLFPFGSEFPAVWREVLGESAAWHRVDCASYVRSWCGEAPEDVASKFAGVNHIGVYLGDYASDEEVFGWRSYLDARERAGDVSAVEMGPSYIAPRQYGTPGWWISASLADGRVIETFTCRLFGAWLNKPVSERERLMSHVALDVASAGDVRAVLSGMARDVDHVEAIAYTEADEMGHTYGHLRNNATQSVLEVVYDAAKKENLLAVGGS